MNAMDLLPLDLPGKVAALFGIHYWRVVPTADANTTFAMSLTVLLVVLFYSFKAKGCLLYTSDAADERSSVGLGGRRIIKNKNRKTQR